MAKIKQVHPNSVLGRARTEQDKETLRKINQGLKEASADLASMHAWADMGFQEWETGPWDGDEDE